MAEHFRSASEASVSVMPARMARLAAKPIAASMRASRATNCAAELRARASSASLVVSISSCFVRGTGLSAVAGARRRARMLGRIPVRGTSGSTCRQRIRKLIGSGGQRVSDDLQPKGATVFARFQKAFEAGDDPASSAEVDFVSTRGGATAERLTIFGRVAN